MGTGEVSLFDVWQSRIKDAERARAEFMQHVRVLLPDAVVPQDDSANSFVVTKKEVDATSPSNSKRLRFIFDSDGSIRASIVGVYEKDLWCGRHYIYACGKIYRTPTNELYVTRTLMQSIALNPFINFMVCSLLSDEAEGTGFMEGTD